MKHALMSVSPMLRAPKMIFPRRFCTLQKRLRYIVLCRSTTLSLECKRSSANVLIR